MKKLNDKTFSNVLKRNISKKEETSFTINVIKFILKRLMEICGLGNYTNINLEQFLYSNSNDNQTITIQQTAATFYMLRGNGFF